MAAGEVPQGEAERSWEGPRPLVFPWKLPPLCRDTFAHLSRPQQRQGEGYGALPPGPRV